MPLATVSLNRIMPLASVSLNIIMPLVAVSLNGQNNASGNC